MDRPINLETLRAYLENHRELLFTGYDGAVQVRKFLRWDDTQIWFETPDGPRFMPLGHCEVCPEQRFEFDPYGFTVILPKIQGTPRCRFDYVVRGEDAGK
jgi:hypothetical protein